MATTPSAEHTEMIEAFGGGGIGIRIASSLQKTGIGSMEALNERAAELGERGFELFLCSIPSVGRVSEERVMQGLKRYRLARLAESDNDLVSLELPSPEDS
jgi:hypothetical protein